MTNDNPLKHILGIELNTGKKTLFLENNTYTIGRSSSNNIIINNRVISRHHSTLIQVIYQNIQTNTQEKEFWILDGDLKGNKSTNGIFVNGKKRLLHQLKAGDIIVLGGMEVRAKYDIVDIKSKTFYSLINQNSANESSSEEINESQDLSTVATFDNQKNIEPLKDFLIKRLKNFNEVYDYPFLTVNTQGEIIKISEKMKEEFPSIEMEKTNHPLLQNIDLNSFQDQVQFLVKDIRIEDKSFTVYIYDNQKEITVSLINADHQNLLREQLAIYDEQSEDFIEKISEGVVFVDVETKTILHTNSSYYKMLGYENKEDLLNQKIDDLLILDHAILVEDINRINQDKIIFSRESIHIAKDKSLVPVKMMGQMCSFLGKKTMFISIQNMTEEKKLEDLLRYQNYHDVVTNLPNYKLFREQLYSALVNQKKEDQSGITLVLVKINEWRNIGYQYGYDIAEVLLKKVAKKLKKSLSLRDLIYRWRDDEFAIMLSQIESSSNLDIEDKIIDITRKSLLIDNQEIKFSFTLAKVNSEEDSSDENLLQSADKILAQKYYQYIVVEPPRPEGTGIPI